MDVFKPYYAHIQDNLCAYIQDNSFFKNFYMHIPKTQFICVYSRHNLYAYIQDKFYMHIFKTHFICIYTFKIQFISLYLSRSPVYIIHEEYLKNWPEPTENHISTHKF